MEEREIKLVHEQDGWQIYQDGLPVFGKSFAHRDEVIAKFEAKQLAKKLLLDKFIMIDYCGNENIIYLDL